MCPNCGSDAGFGMRTGAGRCGETGYQDGDYLVCEACGAETDADEIERAIASAERIGPKTAPQLEASEEAA